MKTDSLEQLLKELSQAYKNKERYPFPTKDCNFIIGNNTKETSIFIIDLDLYFLDIAGYCSQNKRITNWSHDEIKKAQTTLSKTFFDKHPQYQIITPLITQTNTPQLYKTLFIYDSLRILLLKIISHLAPSEITKNLI